MYATELGHQREALVQRLSEFNNTNRKLRTLLRDQQAKEVSEVTDEQDNPHYTLTLSSQTRVDRLRMLFLHVRSSYMKKYGVCLFQFMGGSVSHCICETKCFDIKRILSHNTYSLYQSCHVL